MQNYRFHERDTRPTEFRVEIEINGKMQRFESVISRKQETGPASDVPILEFDYDPNQRQPEDPAALARGPYANYQDSVILQQWQSVLPPGHILKIEDPKAIIDVMLGVLAIVGGGADLDAFIADMKGRAQTDLRQDQALRTLGELAAVTRMGQAQVHGSVQAAPVGNRLPRL